MKRTRIPVWVGIGLLLLVPALALGAYPEREITVYCGSSAGGTTDMGIRLLSDIVSKSLDNRSWWSTKRAPPIHSAPTS